MIKTARSKTYNYNFNIENGMFVRWGTTLSDDPQWSPVGPELADIEISTICHGLGKPCSFCYKSNSASGKNMTLDQFRIIFAKLPSNVMQIAFGIGDVYGNADMLPIFQYTRDYGVIPNVTVTGFELDNYMAKNLAEVCGAVAVSRYDPSRVCYDAVEKLTSYGLKQVNIHQLTSNETLHDCYQVLDDVQTDKRLKNLNAVVFLSAKRKGRGKWLTPLSMEQYQNLINTAFSKGIRIGFDSCSAHKFLKCIDGKFNEKLLQMVTEPCESNLFSIYVNIDGIAYPCSFSPHEDGIQGINLLEVKDFMTEVWNSEIVNQWRTRLLENNRACPLFEV